MKKPIACLVCLFSSLTVNAQELVVNFDVVGLNQNQLGANRAITNACSDISELTTTTAAQVSLQSTCSIIAELNDDDPLLGNILDQLIPEEIFAVSDSITDASDLQISNIYSRIHKLQLEQTGTISMNPISGGQYAHSGMRNNGGAASQDGSMMSKLQLFASGHVSSGEYTGAELQQNADIDSNNLTTGLDYRLKENFIIGAGVGVLQTDTAFHNNTGRVTSDGVNLTFFGTYLFSNNTYADVVLDAGIGSYKIRRAIDIAGLTNTTSTAETDSTTFSLSGSLGGNFTVGSLNLGPYVRGSYTHASVDSFKESENTSSPGAGLALAVGAQSVSSATLTLGAQVSRAFNTSKAVFVPQFNLEFESEIVSDKDALEANFLADPDQNLMTIDGDKRDTSYMNLGIGSSAVLANGKSAFVFLEIRMLHDFLTQSWLKAGFRWEF